MIIEKVVKKDDRNVIIFFDNDEKLIIAYEIFLQNGLKKNDEVSESRFSFLIEQNQIYFLKQRAFHLLGRRHHSSYELKLKLRQKGYKTEYIEQVVEELNTKGLLNDYEFASSFCEENIRTKFWGKKKVESELYKRGITREIIYRVIEEKFTSGNELDNALELGRKKLKIIRTRKIDSDKVRTKLYSFLLSKGYDYDVCKKAVEILTVE